MTRVPGDAPAAAAVRPGFRRIVGVGATRYIRTVAKTGKSWMPKGRVGMAVRASARPPSTGAVEVVATVKAGAPVRSSPSSNYALRDGTVITSVRRDVLDRALGRGEFGKK